jgi:hypothetical protein
VGCCLQCGLRCRRIDRIVLLGDRVWGDYRPVFGGMLFCVSAGRASTTLVGTGAGMIKKLWREIYVGIFLRSWFMSSAAYAATSVCPCCGKHGCPAGGIFSLLVGGVVTAIVAVSIKAYKWGALVFLCVKK